MKKTAFPDIAAEIAALSPRRRQVLEILTQAAKPMSAYEILDQLRDEGITGPPIVYRALTHLIGRHLVHRIESLNAYVACHHHGVAHDGCFAICTHCDAVVEIPLHDISAQLAGLAGANGFHLERTMIELSGHCAACHRAHDSCSSHEGAA